MAGETHQSLIQIAAKWLSKNQRCCVVATDIVTSVGETPDAIGWTGWQSILIEVKASRADFHRDRHKASRRRDDGILPDYGPMGDIRYYMAPEGVLHAADIPEAWGLLTVNDNGKVRVAKEPAAGVKGNKRHEVAFLLSVIRRMGPSPLKGMGVKFYELEGKRIGTVGIEPTEES